MGDDSLPRSLKWFAVVERYAWIFLDRGCESGRGYD